MEEEGNDPLNNSYTQQNKSKMKNTKDSVAVNTSKRSMPKIKPLNLDLLPSHHSSENIYVPTSNDKLKDRLKLFDPDDEFYDVLKTREFNKNNPLFNLITMEDYV